MNMQKIRNKILRGFYSWEKWQIIWLFLANGLILGVSLYMKDSPLGVIASLTGVTCVILCGMGKLSNYIFGTVNVILYAIVAWKAKYYGDVMLNLLYYFPTNFLGFFVWSKHIDQEKNEVYKKRMTLKQDVFLAVISIAGVLGYSFLLKLLGGNLPIVDSMSTVFSVIAQILMIKRFMEQWVIWIIVDIVSVIMWIAAFFTGGESVAVLMMWSVYLANAVIMFVKWHRESAGNNTKEEKCI